MSLDLKDIIDLEYLIRQDDILDNETDVQDCIDRDREIFSKIDGRGKDRKTLLAGWLAHRRNREPEAVLPGTMIATLYRIMVYLMIVSGTLTGVSLTASFLAYHGNRPINVTLYCVVFIMLPLAFTLTASAAGVRRLYLERRFGASRPSSFMSVVMSTIMFKGLPGVLKRFDWDVVKKGRDAVIDAVLKVKINTRTFQGLLFWPFFILTSFFSVGFSIGALGTSFFRVMISDMAFGWQSTLLTSAKTVHQIVSLTAWPWAALFPGIPAHPGLDQIEGSRIILKDGIEVLATRDLVSWWPFLCLGIIFYALIPRLLLMAGAVAARKRAVSRFDFNTSLFNDLIARMTSPALSVDIDETPVSLADRESPAGMMADEPEEAASSVFRGQTAVLLISRQVYSEQAESHVRQAIKNHMGCRVRRTLDISFDFQVDEPLVRTVDFGTIDQVILVQEAWQPPIRGLLYYLSQVAEVLPRTIRLLIVLTNDAGLEDLGVAADDTDYSIWKKAVFQLGAPQIQVKGLNT